MLARRRGHASSVEIDAGPWLLLLGHRDDGRHEDPIAPYNRRTPAEAGNFGLPGYVLSPAPAFREPQILAYIKRLSELAAELPKLIGDVVQSRKQTGRLAEPGQLGQALGRAEVYRKALDTLEEITRVWVVNDPPAPRRRLRLRWWRA